ncbi:MULTISPECIES: M20 metallopeptidase family protein [Clostridium]|uniref:Thermostable carboxypeptidase 1 n=3 Tax=Clostridium TaxID=1485 RepID=C4IL01_CLOBU|nr:MULTISPECIES: amidohydrolase [Clostridium]ALP90904.1 carboxypeptidase [Clostridium butyricum]ALS17432.1 carboxypeptidase [Clostridium butyricum]ANF14526.1 carboxypeptidase [Clostridium butyricum]AOR94591.1 carboxypeptidase [Clostridium butyricum]EDT76597.1 thermostable carboxypeptidase 1 [Clostridium butyricum 5521]
MNIIEEAKNISSKIIEDRRELHKIPETGMILPKTAQYVINRLKKLNIDFKTYDSHSGICAVIGKKEGKTIAVRGDMDALPVKEETNLEFKSENGNMHACGHDAHTAILLGLAELLKNHEHELNGKVKLIFQPCEECGPGGAMAMIEDNVLENPKVDAMLALHTDNAIRDYENGDVIVRYGSMSAYEDPINLKIIGKGGHASTPHVCIDPISIATLIINNIQYILTREIDQTIPTLISFTSIQGGRGSNNIIPDVVEVKGTLRSTDSKVREYVLDRIVEIVDGLTKIMKAKYEINFLGGCSGVVNNRDMVDKFITSAEKIIGKESIHVLNDYNMGAEDAGFFFEKVPGCYFLLYNPLPFDDGVIYPAHNSKFMMDDSVLYKGAALFMQTVIDYLG